MYLQSLLLSEPAEDAVTSCAAHLQKLGYPSVENLHFKTDHVLSYSNRMRGANWVFEGVCVCVCACVRACVRVCVC